MHGFRALCHDVALAKVHGNAIAGWAGLLPTMVAAEAPQPVIRSVLAFARRKGRPYRYTYMDTRARIRM